MTADLTALTLTQLLSEQDAAKAAKAAATARMSAVEAELSRRYAASVGQALAQKGKDYGTVTLPMQDRLRLKCDVKREVKWDSDGLMAIAQTLPWERVKALFKIEFSMPEAIYKGVSALSPELRAKIDDARTETTKPAKITIEKEADA